MECLILIIFLVCLFASIIQGLLGFGFAILFMAIIPFCVPLKTAVALGLILGLATTTRLFYSLRKHVKIKLIYIPALSFSIFSNLGVYLLMNFKGGALAITFGFILILFAVIKMFKKEEIIIKPSKKNAIIAGSIGGLLGGMFNIGGPPLAIYYLSALEDVKEYNSTIQLTFIIVGIYNIFLHSLYGNINYQIFKYSLSGIAAILIGSTIALKILKKINKEKLNYWIYIFIMIVGFILIIKEIIK